MWSRTVHVTYPCFNPRRCADAQMSRLYWSIAQDARCSSARQLLSCAAYTVMGDVNAACTAIAFAIALTFAAFGYILNNSSARLRWCEPSS